MELRICGIKVWGYQDQVLIKYDPSAVTVGDQGTYGGKPGDFTQLDIDHEGNLLGLNK